MLRVEPAPLFVKWILGNLSCRILQRRSRNPVPVPLLPPFANEERLRFLRFVSCTKLAIHQPNALAQKHKQERSRQKLRTAESFAREIWTHNAEPSVLPCRRRFAEKVLR